MTPQEAAEQYAIDKDAYNYEVISNAFQSGAQWQHAQDYQALSSALKEIAELHAKLHEMSEYITKVQSNNDDLEFANSELHAKMKDLNEGMCENCRIKQNLKLWANGDELESYPRPVMTSKNTYGFTSESHPEPDSANLPPESAS